jgi:BRG1-associated factor 45A
MCGKGFFFFTKISLWQVTEYLHVKSFKRKYPDCPRRVVDMEERDFLMEMKIVNETQADLGLTAIPSSSVLDIMCQVSIFTR